MSVAQYQSGEEDSSGEEEEVLQRSESAPSSQQVPKEMLLDDDVTPATILARYAAADPIDEEADDALLVAEKIRLLREENVRLRQTLGVPCFGESTR